MAYFKREEKKLNDNFLRLQADMTFKFKAGEVKHLSMVAIDDTGLIIPITTIEKAKNLIGVYTGETRTFKENEFGTITTQAIIGKDAIEILKSTQDYTKQALAIAELKKIGVYVVDNLNGEKEA